MTIRPTSQCTARYLGRTYALTTVSVRKANSKFRAVATTSRDRKRDLVTATVSIESNYQT